MKKSPEQYKELSYTLHPDSKIVNILSQFGHVLSLFTILSLNLWRARCRHNIPSSLNIALCVSQTTVILLHLHAILPKYQPSSTAQTPFQSTVPIPHLSPCGPGSSPICIFSSFQTGIVPPFYLSFESSAVWEVRMGLILSTMTLNPDPPDASSVPDSGHAREAGRPQYTDVMACAVLPPCLWHSRDVNLGTWLCWRLFHVPTLSSPLPFSNQSACCGDFF